jgi:hypothetical protein
VQPQNQQYPQMPPQDSGPQPMAPNMPPGQNMGQPPAGYPPQMQPGQPMPQMQQRQPMPMQPGQMPPQMMPAQPMPMQGQPVQQYPPQGQMPPQNQPPQTQAPRPKNTTQNSLLFSEIRDNMLIMADGSFRAVIACKSINFDLMSSREREGVEYSYQNFINSLTHPVQILIRSQKVDIGPYLERLSNIRKQQDNMLLGVLMDDYIEFIEILSDEANIMDKSFYVVIPYATIGDLSTIKDAGKGFFGKLLGTSGGGPSITKIDKITYEKAKDEIKNRIDSVTSGLFQMGVHCVQLNSKELGELYYNYYNPDTAVREPLSNFEQNTFTYVKKGSGEAPRPNLNGGGM